MRQRVESSAYATLPVKLPSFVIAVLRRRAKDGKVDVSDVVERLILETMMLDEVQAMINESPTFARKFAAWFRAVVGKRT